MAEHNFEKTEAPTPRRRREAREEGNVARSTDLTAAVVLLAGILLLHALGFRLLTALRVLVESMLSVTHAANPTRGDDLSAVASYAGRVVLPSLGPLVLGVVLVAFLASVGQVGFLLTAKPLKPSMGRLSPLRGFKRLFDARAGVRLVMSVGKIALIAAAAVVVVRQDMPGILKLPQLGVRQAFENAAQLVFSLGLKLAALLLFLALLDYAFQKWQHTRDLRMSKQDVKEELKRMEGDPLTKQRRVRVGRQLAMQRIQHAVPQADVIVTNPTHYAVALRYDSQSMTAPKVIAKGADYLALRIRQIALLHGVPMVERKTLAQSFYRDIEVGQEVPPQFYGAVAEILAYVYRIGGRRSA